MNPDAKGATDAKNTPCLILLHRIEALDLRVAITLEGKVKLLGPVDRIDPAFREELGQAREALVVAVLTREADRLREELGGPAPYAARLGRVPEFNLTLDRLAAARQRLHEVWKARGWTVAWDGEREVFTLTGSGSPPAGSEEYQVLEVRHDPR